ncbi:hypothetical protein MVEN_00171300 [Mycena venus]|uniref:Uncharacterized protein n=1 Tax=Mycena venus TaxID=2733690 RepID=A0A8H6Z238_9AGAR|nr:hypothetical protein MVEN_00171300 [Mycena venus]
MFNMTAARRNIENFIVHNSPERYFINSHAFHNAHLLRATFPRSLISPIPLFRDQDRQAHHTEMATALRATLETRRTKLKAVAAVKKRKAAPDNEQEPPPKRKKTSATRAPRATASNGTMVATRAKRIITKTSRAEAAMSDESEDEEENLAADSDGDKEDLYNFSDDVYSD